MKSTYDICLPLLLGHEGGYTNDVRDPVAQRISASRSSTIEKIKPDVTAADVRAMSIEQAKRIYRARYWDVQRCDELPAGVDYAIFDYGVNSGIGRSGKVLRRLLNVPGNTDTVEDAVIAAALASDAATLVEAICGERLRFLQSLKTWSAFGTGWARRSGGSAIRQRWRWPCRRRSPCVKLAEPR